MNNRPRAILASMAVLALTATAACTSAQPDASPGPDATGDAAPSGSLRIATTNDNADGLNAVLDIFKERHPGVDVKTALMTTPDLQSTLRTQLSSGTGPDVFFTWPGNGNPMSVQNVAPLGFLADLSGQSWVDKQSDSVKSVTQVDGKQWIAPASFAGIGAIYNTTATEAAGLTPPTTWSEVLQFCADAAAKGKVAYAAGFQDDWVAQMPALALTPELVYVDDPEFNTRLYAGTQTFADSAWRDTFAKYTALADAGCFQPDPNGTSFSSAVTMLARGDALAFMQVTAVMAGVIAEAPAGTELKLLPMPGSDDPAKAALAGAVGVAFGVNAKAQNPVAAQAFIDLLMSDEGQIAYNEASGSLPPITVDGFTPPDAVAELINFQQAGRTAPFADQMWPNPKVQSAMMTGVQDVFAGTRTWDDVLKAMDTAFAEGAGS